MGIFDFKRKNDLYDELDESEKRKNERNSAPVEYAGTPQMTERVSNGALQMQLLRPTDFTEATKVADCLKAGRAVLLNLEGMQEKDARRMIDYLAGVLYAVDGKIEHPAQRTFLLAPRGVSVASEEVDKLRPRG